MKQILLLHGSRQTGQLLLGRMDKLRKKLQKEGYELVAPDATFVHPDDGQMRHWWNRHEDDYEGLETSMDQIGKIWKEGNFVGVMGFSQGARFVHLLLLAHDLDPSQYLPGIQFGILVAGYEAAVPPNFDLLLRSGVTQLSATRLIQTPSLHVFGATDRLIPPESSQAVAALYQRARLHQHEGGHHVPMKAADTSVYLDFIQQTCTDKKETEMLTTGVPEKLVPLQRPDDETAELQRDEVEALQAIFMDEFTLLSNSTSGGDLEHPISYRILLVASNEGWWPPHPISLEFQYPHNYPQESMPTMKLVHNNNGLELPSATRDACLAAMKEAWEAEQGMPCVMSCVYAARDFFETSLPPVEESNTIAEEHVEQIEEEEQEEIIPINNENSLPSCSEERIQECIEEGLQIAEEVMAAGDAEHKGGSYKLTIGLVGKPSAGKSTFFNVGTAFARQRGDGESTLGGATMAPHPFTTIDPNVGYCLVPAPAGSCPEDEYFEHSANRGSSHFAEIGCTHGRDSNYRRLIPVLLKDVAGLVPGAYQGRGRGNKFLNDLTDAHVLIHILDASGMADESGNAVGTEEDGNPCEGASHPLSDLAWIRKELIEWVYTNLVTRWDTIRRRGRSKLSGMFSGYGQSEGVTTSVLMAVEKFARDKLQQHDFLDNLDTWDTGDVHRLVSAFLGVRFPVVLALNKKDLPPSEKHISDIQEALPVHGAHVGIPLSANNEVEFMRDHIEKALGLTKDSKPSECPAHAPLGVWKCLQEAVTLANPIVVFPVSDFVTLAPIPGLTKYATTDSSLPSLGMISCLEAAGGSVPSHWDTEKRLYTIRQSKTTSLRDAIVMKPCSTVEDLFLTLKRMGAYSGEFVRAEAMGDIVTVDGKLASPKPIPKHSPLGKDVRIIRIMTSKRTEWQIR